MISAAVPASIGRPGAGAPSGRDAGSPKRGMTQSRPPSSSDFPFKIAGRTEGDVDARVWVRIEEARSSIELIRQMLKRLELGPVLALAPAPGVATTSGAAMVEGFRGDVLINLRIGEDGRIAHLHARDPSCFQWPLLEAAIEGNIVADFPLCNKSFNCSYSGHDM